MASFEIFYPKLKQYEGGYASAAFAASINDKGGETYKGIARNFNPDWSGWKIIDAYKLKNGLPKYNSIIPDPNLDKMAKDHSKKAYWDKLRLDEVKNQHVAEAIGDFGFNSGLGTAAKAVQRILKLPVDGKIGPATVSAINAANQQKLFADIQNYRRDFIKNITSLSEQIKNSLLGRVDKLEIGAIFDQIKKNPGKTLMAVFAVSLIIGSILILANNN